MFDFHWKTIHYFKSVYKRFEKSAPARTGSFVRPAPGCSPNSTFSMSQRRHVTTPYNNPLFFVHFFIFFKSHWRHHFSYGFDMTSSCHKCCGLPKLSKFQRIQFYHIFSTFFNDFMLAQFSVASAKLQTIQQTCLNMLRFRALMSPKPHCA